MSLSGVFGQAQHAPASKFHQLSVVDIDVDDANHFAQSLADRSAVALLPHNNTPLATILSELKASPGVSNLHLYSHAKSGELSIGGQTLDFERLSAEQLSTLAAIGEELGEQGGIYFYGCNFAAGVAGQSLVNTLADVTGVDVWASDDVTGANALLGDWQLEVASSNTASNPIAVEAYQYTLDLLVTPTQDATALQNMIIDPNSPNVTVHSTVPFGVAGQIATFTNGLSVPGFITFEDGIILSSGTAVSIAGPNAGDNTGSDVNGIQNDPQFDALTIATGGTDDAAYIEVTFTPQGDTITGTFVFASDEYNEYAPPAGTSSSPTNFYYDVMAFFVNDVNYSITASGDNVSINTVNETLNAADFISNDREDDGIPTPINIEPDGFTRRLTWTAPVNVGVVNTLKFGIADGGDATYNSWLLVDKHSLSILNSPADVDLAISKTDNLTEVVDGDPIGYEISVTNTGAEATGREITVVDTLPAGVTINGGLAESVIEVGANAAEWTCLSDAATPQNITCKSTVPIQTNVGNNTAVFGFVTDPISQVVGTTLINSVVMTSEDIDSTTANNTASDSSIVTASDTAPPVSTLSGVPSLISNTDPFTVTVTFNEDVTGVDLADLSVIGGVASNLVSVDARTYTVVITPDATGDVVVGVIAGAAQDGAGNTNAATATQTAVLAANAVDLSLLNVPAQTSGSSPYNVTFEFSEDVIGFDISDITVINGIATNFVIVDGNTYTVDVQADGTGDVEIQVADGAAQDTAGVDQTLAASGSTILNLSAPTVVISGEPAVINTTSSYTLAVEFSEDVTGFDAADLSITNAAIVAVTAIDGNSYTVEVQPDGNGDIAVSIPEGSAIDIASNVNTLSNTVNTVYDVIGPEPITTGLPVVTNTTTALPVTITFDEPVTGFDLTDIQVINGSVANLVMVDSQTFTVEVTPDGIGDIDITVPPAAAQDTVGNDSLAAVPVSVIYDDTAPTLIITPVTGDNIINALEDDTDVLVSGTSAGLENGQTVTVSINGTDYTTTANNDSWSITLPAAAAQLLDPTEQFTANASDVAGNAATTATAAVIYDATAPAEPVVGSLLTNNVHPVLMGTAALVSGDSLQVTVEGVTYIAGAGDLMVNGDGTWVLTIPATHTLPEGVLDVTAVVTDSSGNTASDQTTNEVVVDITAPVDPLIALDLVALSDTGSVDNDDVTQDATGEFAVPAGTIAAGDTVTLYADGVASGTATVLADGSFSADIATLADDVYAIQFSITDPAGNESALSPALNVTVDTVIAAPTIDGPIATDDIINLAEQNTVLVSGTAEANSTVVVTLSDGANTDVTVQVTADATGNYTLLGSEADIQSLDEGSITITAVSTDLAGNTETSLPLSVTLDASAPAIPVVDTLISNSDTPQLTGSVALDPGDVFEVVVSGVTYTSGDGNLQVAADDVWTLDIPVGNELPENTYEVLATATDSSGNTTVDTSTTELTIDLTAPAVPMVVSSIQSTNLPVIDGTATLEPGESLTVVVNGVIYIEGVDLVVVGSGWQLTVPATNPVVDGVYSVDASITDAAGNTTADITVSELIVDTVVPAVPTVTAQTTNNTQPVIMGSAIVLAGETLSVVVNGVTYTEGDGNLVLNPDDTWALIIPAANEVLEGVYNVDVLVTDAAGNTATESSSGELIIDTTSPVIPSIAANLQTAFDSGVSAVDNITSVTDTVFDVPAGTANPGDTVVLYAEGVEIATTIVAADGSFIANASTLADGSYSIDYTLNDEAGNVSPLSPALTIVIDTATTAPVIDQPIELDSIVNATEQTDVLISGTAEVNSSVLVTLTDEALGTVTQTVTTNSSGVWTLTGQELDLSLLQNGVINVTADATDLAGNMQAALPVDITLDRVLPVITIDQLSVDNIINAAEDDVDITISGTVTNVEDGQSVSVTLNSKNYSASVAGGVWSLTLPALDAQALAATNTLTAEVNNLSGNAAVQATSQIAHDVTIPELTFNLIAVDNTINATEDDSDVIVSGTSVGLEDDQVVTVAINGTDYTTTVTNDSWSITLPAAAAQLLDPTEQITANASDVAGNAATTATADVIHDVTAPAEPVVTSLLTNNVSPVLTGTAILAAGDTLEVTVDGVTYTDATGDLVVNPDDTWVLTIPATQTLPEGVVDVVAVVTDSAGNTVSDQTSNEVVVDTTVPTTPLVALDLATLSDTGSVDTDDITADATGEFTVPAGTVTAGDTVTLYADGVVSGATTVLADGSFSADITTLADGTHTIAFSVTDPAGNESALSPSLDVTVDTVIVEPTIDSPLAADDIINSAEQSAVLVSGAAETNSTVVVTLSDGVNPDVTVQVIADAVGAYTLLGSEADIQSLVEGPITISVTATDIAGNNEISLPSIVTLDTSAPAVPVVNAVISNSTTPQITGSATVAPDDLFEVTVNSVTYTDGDGSLAVDAGGVWVLDIPLGNELLETQYDVIATVTDLGGNASVDASTTEVTIDLTAPATPTVVSSIQSFNQPVIIGTAVLAAGESLSVVVDGISYTEGVDLVVVGSDWQLTVPATNPVADGVYSVDATIIDAAGNTTSDITSAELIVDTVVPATPTVAAQTTNNTQPVIIGSATVLAGETLSVVLNSVTYIEGDGDLVLNPDGTWELTVPATNELIEGVYNVDVVVTDAAGNIATESTSGELIVDTTSPVIPAIAPNLQTAFDSGVSDVDNITSVTVTVFDVPAGTANPGDTVVLYAEGVEIATTTVAADGSYVANASALADGSYNIQYTLTDDVGNVSALSPTLSIEVDTATTAPVIDAPIEVDNIVNATEQMDVLISGAAEANSDVLVTLTDEALDSVTQTVTTDSSGVWTLSGLELDLSLLQDGVIGVAADATDLAGNTEPALTVDITLDRVLPAIIIDAVAVDNIVNATEDDADITISGTVTNVEDGQSVAITLNSNNYSAIVAGGVWSLNLPALDAQALGATSTLTADVDNASGNSAVQASSQIAHDVTIPELTINPIAVDNIINATEDDSDVIVSGTSIGLEDGQVVTVAINGTDYTTTVTNDSWSVTLPAAAAQLLDLAEQIGVTASGHSGQCSHTGDSGHYP